MIRDRSPHWRSSQKQQKRKNAPESPGHFFLPAVFFRAGLSQKQLGNFFFLAKGRGRDVFPFCGNRIRRWRACMPKLQRRRGRAPARRLPFCPGQQKESKKWPSMIRRGGRLNFQFSDDSICPSLFTKSEKAPASGAHTSCFERPLVKDRGRATCESFGNLFPFVTAGAQQRVRESGARLSRRRR